MTGPAKPQAEDCPLGRTKVSESRKHVLRLSRRLFRTGFDQSVSTGWQRDAFPTLIETRTEKQNNLLHEIISDTKSETAVYSVK